MVLLLRVYHGVQHKKELHEKFPLSEQQFEQRKVRIFTLFFGGRGRLVGTISFF